MAKDIWTQSRLKTWQICPYKEALRYREKLAPISIKRSLSIGTAIHKGLETWSIPAALEALRLPYANSQEEQDENDLAEVTVKALLEGYSKVFEPFESHMPEYSFDLPMMNEYHHKSSSYRICGKIDDIATINDENWIVEYKTAGKLDGAYMERLYLDSQITMYMLAAKRLGWKPVGVIYRILRKPQLRKGKTESKEQFLNRLEKDIADRPDFYFTEQLLRRTDEDLEAFEKQLWDETHLANKLYKENKVYPHSANCNLYGQCEYMPICTRQEGCEALYETREPNEELKGE